MMSTDYVSTGLKGVSPISWSVMVVFFGVALEEGVWDVVLSKTLGERKAA
jgi:hypothetical protein